MRILILAAALLAATPAMADDTFAVVSVGTDYMSRGTSQTFGDPAVTIYAEHSFDNGFYIAGFTANVDFDDDKTFYDGTKLEADVFAGYRGSVGKVNYDVGLAAITYYGTKPLPGFNPKGNWNMVEAKVKVNTTFKKTTVGATVGVTPDYFNNYGPSIWTEATVSQVIDDKFTISGAFGRQQYFRASEGGFPAKLSNYNTWNVGVTYNITPTLSVDARYHDNDTVVDLGAIYKPVGVVTLRKVL